MAHFDLSAASSAELLRQAWDEYGFQAWSNTNKLFVAAEAAEDATADQKLQAQIGRALVMLNRMPGRDPEKAHDAFLDVLDKCPEGHRFRPLILASLGACCSDRKKPDMEKARDYYLKAMDASPKLADVAAQEAALRFLRTYTEAPDLELFKKGLAESKKILQRMKGASLESSAHGIVAQLAFNVGDLQRFSDELEAQYECGIKSRSIKEKVLMRLARVNESKLGDLAKAAKYYRKLAEEVPSSNQAYYAQLRADELERGNKEGGKE